MNKIIKNHWNPILIIISSVVISFLYLNNTLIKNFLDNILLAKFKTDPFKIMLIFTSMIIIGILAKFIELGIRFILKIQHKTISIYKSQNLYFDNSEYIENIDNIRYFKLKTIQNNETDSNHNENNSNQNIPEYFYIKSKTNDIYKKNENGDMKLCENYKPIFNRVEMSNVTMKRKDGIVANEELKSKMLNYEGLKAGENTFASSDSNNVKQETQNLHSIYKSKFNGRWFINNVLYNKFLDEYLIDEKFYLNNLSIQFVDTRISIQSPDYKIETYWCSPNLYGEKEIQNLYYFADDGLRYHKENNNKLETIINMKPLTISSCLNSAIQSTFNPFIEKRK